VRETEEFGMREMAEHEVMYLVQEQAPQVWRCLEHFVHVDVQIVASAFAGDRVEREAHQRHAGIMHGRELVEHVRIVRVGFQKRAIVGKRVQPARKLARLGPFVRHLKPAELG